MPYIQRNGGGNIIGVFALAQPGYAEEFLADNSAEWVARLADMASAEAAEADRMAGIKASTYVTDWDANIRSKTFVEIKTLYDGATQAQKSDLLFYLLLVRALEVKG